MSEVIKKTLDLLKDKGKFCNLDGYSVEIQLGTFNGYMQFEKLDIEEDYTSVQCWVGRGSDEDDDFDNNYYELEDHSLEDILDQLIDNSQQYNIGIMKINRHLQEMVSVKNEYELPQSLLLDLIYSSIED